MEPIKEYIEVEDITKVKKFIMKTLEEMVNDPRFDEIVKEVGEGKSHESESETPETELL